jgi:drug/metabolite transporter (DMT)-like permease
MIMAVSAAALYGISAPISKLLLVEIPPTLMAALLYLGAGFGMLFVNALRLIRRKERIEAKMTKRELPAIIGMILLDIAAPILLMLGLILTTAANASLLNNFEIAATTLIALFIFNEPVGRRMWIAIFLIMVSSIVLSVQDFGSLSFSPGSIFVLLATICWGLENNLTRLLSIKDPLQIVVVKGFGSGTGSLIITLILREYSTHILYLLLTLLLGFVAYGLSIFLYVSAQRELGAARTSAFYAAAPFIGVVFSWLILREAITGTFLTALAIMLAGTYFAVTEKHLHGHVHSEVTHEHKHTHPDLHHTHQHKPEFIGEHSHEHVHQTLEHKHAHSPDLHHRHTH